VIDAAGVVVTMARSVGEIPIPENTRHLDWRVGDPGGADIERGPPDSGRRHEPRAGADRRACTTGLALERFTVVLVEGEAPISGLAVERGTGLEPATLSLGS
jgi:hypothetical protein